MYVAETLAGILAVIGLLGYFAVVMYMFVTIFRSVQLRKVMGKSKATRDEWEDVCWKMAAWWPLTLPYAFYKLKVSK